MRKFYLFRVAAVFAVSLLCIFVRAQEDGGESAATEPVITEYPFHFLGYTESVSDSMSWWRRYCVDATTETPHRQKAEPTDVWRFKANADPASNLYVPAFVGFGDECLDALQTLFSPQFYLEQSEDVEYSVTMRFFVPNGKLPSTGETFAVRVHPVVADNECAELYNDYYFDYTGHEPVMTLEDNTVIQSIWLRNLVRSDFTADDNETIEIRLSGGSLPHTGNYRFSIIFVSEDVSQTNIYLTGLSVEKKEARCDLAAGQLISPLSAVSDASQPFSFFVYNNSSFEINRFAAGYRLDHSAVKTDTFDISIPPFQSARVTFDEERRIEAGEHTLSYWVKAEGDMDSLNDTAVHHIWVREALSMSDAAFTFAADESPVGWTAHSDSLETASLWQFSEADGEDGSHEPEAETNAKNRADFHDDYLLSPFLSFRKGGIYTISFSFKPSSPDKNFSVWLCDGNTRDDVYSDNSGKELLWRIENISRTDEREITVFYISHDNRDLCVALRSYGAPSAGKIRLNSLRVAESDTNTMDFVYDFESYDNIDAESRAANHLIFVDQDGNRSNAESPAPSTWGIASSGSTAYGKSAFCRGITGTANDWMVFRPLYLLKDTLYYFSLSARKHTSGEPNVELEFYLQKSVPQYDLPYNSQNTEWKKQKTLTAANFTKIKYDSIKVSESGLYFLSIRNVTSIASSHYTAREAEAAGVYVDNVVLTASERSSVQAVSANIPYTAALGERASLSVTLRNFDAESKTVTCCYRLGDEEAVREDAPNKISPMSLSTYTFEERDFSGIDDATICFWVETEGSEDPVDTVKRDFRRVYPKELPYEEEFTDKTFAEWQVYPASLSSVWSVTQASAQVYSPRYALVHSGLSSTSVPSYLVTPVMSVEEGVCYRVAFRYKRSARGGGEKLRLYYAKGGIEDGFADRAFLHEFSIDSAEYTLCETHIRFPESGAYFLGLQTCFENTSPKLYIDDFSIADSAFAHSTQLALSGLTLPYNLSACDTAHNAEFGFRVRNKSFIDVEEIKLSYSIDEDEPVTLTLGALKRNDSLPYSVKLGRMRQGRHTMVLYIDMESEGGHLDDTLRGEFDVAGPASYPFSENFEGVMRGTGAVDVNGDGKTWEVREDASNSFGLSHCLMFDHKHYPANDVFFTNGFTITAENLSMFETSGRTPVLWFYAKASGATSDRIAVRLVKYGPDGGFASSETLDYVIPTRNYELYNKALSLEEGTYALAFDFVSDESQQVIYIDSIRVGFAPEPKPITNLTYVARMGTMAVFTAEGGEDVNVFHIRKEDGSGEKFYPWNDLEYFALDLRELDSNCTYIARARSINAIGDSGAWSGEVSFKSLHGDNTVPDTTGEDPDTGVHVRVESIELAQGIRVWPNPAVSVLNVDLPEWAEKWEMYDMRGLMWRSGSGRESIFRLSLDGLRPGTYLLRAVGKGRDGRPQTAVTKVIKR